MAHNVPEHNGHHLFTTLLIVVILAVFVTGASLAWQKVSAPADSVNRGTATTTRANEPSEDNATQEVARYRLLSERCDNGTCIVQGPEVPVGYGWLTGYHERHEDSVAFGQGTTTCHVLHITGGNEIMIDHFVGLINNGNSVQELSSGGDLLLNLPFERLTETQRQRLQQSGNSNPVRIQVLNRDPPGRGAQSCESFVDVIEVSA